MLLCCWAIHPLFGFVVLVILGPTCEHNDLVAGPFQIISLYYILHTLASSNLFSISFVAYERKKAPMARVMRNRLSGFFEI